MRFRFKSEEFPERSFSDEKQAGFLAQEVEQVIPEVVNTDSAGWKTVAYGNFAPYLVEAIKAQDRVVAALKAQMAEWEARNLRSATAAQYAAEVAEMKAQIARLQSDMEGLLEKQNRRHEVLEQRQSAAMAKQDARIAVLEAIIDGLDGGFGRRQ